MTRTRSRSTKGSWPYIKTQDGNVLQNSVITFENYEQTMLDEVSSPYDPRRPRFNPCTSSKITRDVVGSFEFVCKKNSNPSLKYVLRGNGVVMASILTAPAVPEPTWSSNTNVLNAQAYALQQALGNVDATPHDFFEDAATWRETLRFLRRPMGSIADLALDWQKTHRKVSKVKQYGKRAKLLANAWTEYRFAFRPLIRSASEAVVAWEEEQNNRIQSRPEYQRSRYNYRINDEEAGREFNGQDRWRVSGSRSMKISACIYYRVNNPMSTQAYRLGLRIRDVPNVLWDLVPLSFVVDRVLDISSSIRGYINLVDPHIEFLGAGTSVRTEKTVVREILRDNLSVPSGYSFEKFTPAQYIAKSVEYGRSKASVNLSTVVPTLQPGNLIDSSLKILDLASLTVQRLKF